MVFLPIPLIAAMGITDLSACDHVSDALQGFKVRAEMIVRVPEKPCQRARKSRIDLSIFTTVEPLKILHVSDYRTASPDVIGRTEIAAELLVFRRYIPWFKSTSDDAKANLS